MKIRKMYFFVSKYIPFYFINYQIHILLKTKEVNIQLNCTLISTNIFSSYKGFKETRLAKLIFFAKIIYRIHLKMVIVLNVLNLLEILPFKYLVDIPLYSFRIDYSRILLMDDKIKFQYKIMIILFFHIFQLLIITIISIYLIYHSICFIILCALSWSSLVLLILNTQELFSSMGPSF